MNRSLFCNQLSQLSLSLFGSRQFKGKYKEKKKKKELCLVLRKIEEKCEEKKNGRKEKVKENKLLLYSFSNSFYFFNYLI